MAVVSLQSYVYPSLWIDVDLSCLYCVRLIFRLLFIDTEFQILKLKAEDSSGRQHILTIKLKSKVTHSLLYTQKAHTQFTVRTGSFSDPKLCIIKWNTTAWCWPVANPNPNRPTSPNAYGMFNLLIANQWFTSAPLNLGQAGEGVERHDNPLWLRCSTDKTSPHRPQRDRKPSSMHRENQYTHAHLHSCCLCSPLSREKYTKPLPAVSKGKCRLLKKR